jgi:GMP synthase (glutamine-hydrolysing)
MKPVLILQHMGSDSPAYLASWLQAQGLPFDLRHGYRGEALPENLRDHSALALLGGEMSANDALPMLRQAEVLIRDGIAHNVPVLGHCLGGQLMARALGARVVSSPAPEVGWHRLQFAPLAAAREWFGPADSAQVFQWHYDSFELPAGATLLASSPACLRQAFAIGTPACTHLAMQFHVELDEAKLLRWSAEADPEYLAAQARWPSVHSAQRMCEGRAEKLRAQQRLADAIYTRWLQPLR